MNRLNLALTVTLVHLACAGADVPDVPRRRAAPRPPGMLYTPPTPAPDSTPPAPAADPYLVPAQITQPQRAPSVREFYVGPQELRTAAAVLQDSVGLELDNFTPNAYQYCQPAAPNGCPVPGADAETYKFFAKDSSQFLINGRPLAFSLPPTRSEPFTVYLDDMRAVGMRVEVDGAELILGMDFEGDGVEIRGDCIRNAGCTFAGSQDRDFPRPRLNLRFSVAAGNGQVQFERARAEVATGAASEDSQMISFVNQAVESALLGEPMFRAFVSSALNAAILRFADPERCTLQDIVATGGQLHLTSLCW